jgi:hypothetical protein
MVLFQPRGRRFRRCFRSLVLGMYVAIVATLPLLHHDIACHIQSPTHCTTCFVGSAERAPDVGAPSATQLVLIGSFSFEAPHWRLPLLCGDLSGRSPPALA